MFITSLSQMEEFVNSRSDLEWDGWDVVRYKKNNNAQFHKNGIYRNGSWYDRTVFPLNNNGWSLPNMMGKINE